jgi:DNA-binding transcriptional regulator YiaG
MLGQKTNTQVDASHARRQSRIIKKIFTRIYTRFFNNQNQKMTNKELRKLRRDKEVTQVKLAEMSGISRATVNRAEKTGKVYLKTMQKLFQVLQEMN